MTHAADEIRRWHESKRGLWGSSPDPAVREALAQHVMPYDDRRKALATLDHWIDPDTGKAKYLQICGLHAMAYERDCLGIEHPLLVRPYLNHNDVGLIVPAAAKAGGRWIEDGDEELCALPGPGDIVRIDNEARTFVHFDCVDSIRDSDSALVCTSGGQGRGNLIAKVERIMVIYQGRGWLVSPEQPYVGDKPNGRMITGRGVFL